jgi:uracil-DNA glycosylase family 4
MSDLLKAADFGVVSHITTNDDFNKSYNPRDFYDISRDDILQKISSLSSDLSERDFEFAIAKPLLPAGFKIKPNIVVDKQISSYKKQPTKPLLTALPSDSENNSDDAFSALQRKIIEAQSLAEQATDLASLKLLVQNFDSALDSQKFAIQTLFYNDADNVDILWVNESVSHDDDRNCMIMSDNIGKMIPNLFNLLGYGRNKDLKNGQIGYTALSFWYLAPSDNHNQTEYQICLPFIKKLIYFLNPKKMIVSGNIPLHHLLGGDDVFKNHGKKFLLLIDDKSFDCYSVFSPAYIACSEVAKKIFWFDLLKILDNNA